MQTKLDAALYYAQMGFYVFPLHYIAANGLCSCGKPKDDKHSPGKHPLRAGWKDEATRNPDVIRKWWTETPNANIAGLMGERAGMIAIDLDRHDGQPDGVLAWNRTPFAQVLTRTHTSPNNGQHKLFRIPAGVALGNATGSLPQGIDVRGNGGYIILPGSTLHNGHNWDVLEDAPLADLPADLLEILKAANVVKAAADFAEPEPGKPSLNKWKLPGYIKDKIFNPPTTGERSENDFIVVKALVTAGATNDEILAVFRSYPIGTQGKFKDKGAHDKDYLGRTIANARARVAEETPAGALDAKDWRERFTPIPADAALEELPPIEFIISDVFQTGSFNILYGAYGTKKSYITMAMAAAIAAGVPFVERATLQGTTLYVDQENGEEPDKRRLKRIRRGLGLMTPGLPMETLAMPMLRLSDANEAAFLEAYIKEKNVRFCVIDALIDSILGTSSKEEDVRPLLENLRQIGTSTGCTLVLQHHENKMGEIMGSVVIGALVDTIVQVTSAADESYVEFEYKKKREGSPSKWAIDVVFDREADVVYYEPAELRAPANGNGNGRNGKKPAGAPELNACEQAILNVIIERGPQTIEDLERHIAGKWKASYIRACAQNLVGKSKLQQAKGQGGRGNKAKFDLWEDGANLIQNGAEQEE